MQYVCRGGGGGLSIHSVLQRAFKRNAFQNKELMMNSHGDDWIFFLIPAHFRIYTLFVSKIGVYKEVIKPMNKNK